MKTVLKPTVFSRMVQKRQLEEVQAAGIEDLENCPFCGFATIPHPDSTVFMCYNPKCMRDSCRFDITQTVSYSELNRHVQSDTLPLVLLCLENRRLSTSTSNEILR